MDETIDSTRHSSLLTPHSSSAFTLIEMILVMALLVIGVSIVSPHLSEFFRGRTLKYEGRQMLSLMHEGQSRAVSGGVPIVLWIDTKEQKYGIEEEPGYTDKDPDAVEFKMDEKLSIQIPDDDPSANSMNNMDNPPAEANGPHAGMPQITFLPDGTVAETSPQTVKIVEDNGPTLTLTQTRDRNEYEIGTNTPAP
jgi:prepilin-type N-terminal cleavage/methylation domain-containing protein